MSTFIDSIPTSFDLPSAAPVLYITTSLCQTKLAVVTQDSLILLSYIKTLHQWTVQSDFSFADLKDFNFDYRHEHLEQILIKCEAIWHQSGRNVAVLFYYMDNGQHKSELLIFQLYAGNTNSEDLQIEMPDWVLNDNTLKVSLPNERLKIRLNALLSSESSKMRLFENLDSNDFDGLPFKEVDLIEQVCITSIDSSKNMLVASTYNGKLIPILWSGETIYEQQKDICNMAEKEIISLSIGFYKLLAAFVLDDGSVNLSLNVKKSSKKGSKLKLPSNLAFLNYLERDIFCFDQKEFKNASSVKLHPRDRMILIGKNSHENASVMLCFYHFISDSDISKSQINNKVEVIIEKAVLYELKRVDLTFKTFVERFQWYPDTDENHVNAFAVIYHNIGALIWNSSGALLNSLVPEDLEFHEESNNRNRVAFCWTLNGFQLCTSHSNRVSLFHCVKLLSQPVIGFPDPTLLTETSVHFPSSQLWQENALEFSPLHFQDILPHDCNVVSKISVSTYPQSESNQSERIMSDFSDKISSIALCGKSGLHIYSFSNGKWNHFSNLVEEKSITCQHIFWFGTDAIGLINNDSGIFSLKMFNKDQLDLNSTLCNLELSSIPIAISARFETETLVIQFETHIIVYHADVRGNEIIVKEVSKVQTRYSSPIMMKNKTSVCGERPKSISLLPCGSTRKAGSQIPIPLVVVTTELDNLFVVRPTNDFEATLVSSSCSQIFLHNWEFLKQGFSMNELPQNAFADRLPNIENVHVLPEDESELMALTRKQLSSHDLSRIPDKFLFSVWISGNKGVRLWLPAIDQDGDFLSIVLSHFDQEVIPVGLIPEKGILIGATQTRNVVQLQGNDLCFQIGLKTQPTTHGLLRWLIETGRTRLASHILVHSRNNLALFSESLELLLYHAVESDYRHEIIPAVLPRVLALIMKGQGVVVFPPAPNPRSFNAVVASCARKLEPKKWDVLFPMIGLPSNFFNECIYKGDLQTASAFLLICDHYEPNKTFQKIKILKKLAQESEDSKLLMELEHFQRMRSATNNNDDKKNFSG